MIASRFTCSTCHVSVGDRITGATRGGDGRPPAGNVFENRGDTTPCRSPA